MHLFVYEKSKLPYPKWREQQRKWEHSVGLTTIYQIYEVSPYLVSTLSVKNWWVFEIGLTDGQTETGHFFILILILINLMH